MRVTNRGKERTKMGEGEGVIDVDSISRFEEISINDRDRVVDETGNDSVTITVFKSTRYRNVKGDARLDFGLFHF